MHQIQSWLDLVHLNETKVTGNLVRIEFHFQVYTSQSHYATHCATYDLTGEHHQNYSDFNSDKLRSILEVAKLTTVSQEIDAHPLNGKDNILQHLRIRYWNRLNWTNGNDKTDSVIGLLTKEDLAVAVHIPLLVKHGTPCNNAIIFESASFDDDNSGIALKFVTREEVEEGMRRIIEKMEASKK